MGLIIQTATIVIATDNDLSGVVDFGRRVNLRWVLVPTLTSATFSFHAATEADDGRSTLLTPASLTYRAIAGEAGTALTFPSGGAGTGNFLMVFDQEGVNFGGFQFWKVATSAGQGADRVFTLGAYPC